MTGENPRKRKSPVLEIMSPRELRHYLAYWSDATFERFLWEARACQVMAEMQLHSIYSLDGFGPELREWARTLDLIDEAIVFAETSKIVLKNGYVLPHLVRTRV